MSPHHPSALLAGATGLVGSHLLRELLGRTGADGSPTYGRVTVVTRRPLAEALGPGAVPREGGVELREVHADFDHLSRLRDALQSDHVFCALGTTMRKAGSRERFRRVDFDYPRTVAHVAREAGARHFSLVSSIGAGPGARGFYLRVKGEAEEAVAGVGYPSVTIVRPSVIGGTRGESRPGEAVAKWLLSVVPGRYRTIHPRDIAACMVTLALREAPGVRIVESEEIRRIAALS